MDDEIQRAKHWRKTATLAAFVAIMAIGVAIAAPLLASRLNVMVVLGFPLGYLLAAQGVLIVFIVGAFWFAGRQEKLDRAHGALVE